MNLKKQFMKRTVSGLIALMLMVSGVVYAPLTVRAEGWLDEDVAELKLGEAVMGSIKAQDYRGGIEGTAGDSLYYWKIYEFSMPQDGLLDMYMESAEGAYLSSTAAYDGFAIFDGSEPDDLIWRSCKNDYKINKKFSSARAMYYGSAQISLNEGDYYFAIRQQKTYDSQYYLTLSYQRPVINVSSLTLSHKKLSMKDGDKKTLRATVLPSNATNKAVEWSSEEPSVAAVSDKGVVTGISAGTTSITASSADGEISAVCEVTVKCNHKYQTTITPASTKKNGSKVVKCPKCKDKKTTKIYAAKSIELSKTSYSRSGKACRPSVKVKNSKGKTLKAGRDYTVAYQSGTENVGRYFVTVKFKGNYTGTVKKYFTVVPKPTSITKIESKKRGFSAAWKKQMDQSTGYELVYSTESTFPNGGTAKVVMDKNTKVSGKASKLARGRLYYVRVRVYTNVNYGKKGKALYSKWSKVRAVVVK